MNPVEDTMDGTKRPYRGGCACGAIRFEIPGEPVFQNHCQCLQCQAMSGTGHASFLTFMRAGVRHSGQAAQWAMTGDSGAGKVRAFCPTCGSPLFVTYPSNPAVITVHATSLDEPDRFAPQVVTYASRARAWDRLDPALATFDGMPTGQRGRASRARGLQVPSACSSFAPFGEPQPVHGSQPAAAL